MADLSGKHIIVTGAASGIGAATARLLMQRGATVAFADIHYSACQEAANKALKNGYKAYAVAVDVSNKKQVAALFKQAIDAAGNIDIVVNNAGIDHQPAALHEIDDQVFLNNINVNLTGVWYCMKQALPLMLSAGKGHIINIASVAGLRSAPSASAYSAAKHGVVGLSKSAAAEYARANIRVNVVCPSFIDTPMVQGILKQLPEKQQRNIVGANPMKRLGTEQEVAVAIAWLCSDESSFMTGHSMVLDGGMLA